MSGTPALRPGLLSRVRRSRPVGKFLSNRPAVAATGVIAVFVLVGVACLAGVISAGDASGRVGPDAVPGWLEGRTPEKRLRDAEFYRNTVESALKRADPAAVLREIALGERRVAPVPVDELRIIVKQAAHGYDEVAELLDQASDIDARLSRAARPGVPARDRLDAAAVAAKHAERSVLERAAEGRLEQLERTTQSLFPMPEGSAGTLYRLRMMLGTDRQGRSIAVRAVYSVRIALQVGVVVGIASVAIGTLLGALAGFFGGWTDHAVTWLYSTLSSIPQLVLLSVLAYVFQGVRLVDELIPVYAALALTFWIGPCRVVRGEVLKLKEMEYVQAATVIGFSRARVLLRHVVPNTAHLMLINFSLLFIGAIKAEVILTFLGLGVKNGASWGVMIEQSRQEVINGNFWQIGTATAFMFALVLSFNIVSDALQDAFDPKHVG